MSQPNKHTAQEIPKPENNTSKHPKLDTQQNTPFKHLIQPKPETPSHAKQQSNTINLQLQNTHSHIPTQPKTVTSNQEPHQPNQPNPTNPTPTPIHHPTYQGHTYSALRRQQTVYLIALTVATQNTHIVKLTLISNHIPANECYHEQIKNWIKQFIPHYTNPNIVPAYETYKIPIKLQALLTNLNNTPNRNDINLQHSVIINDIENHSTNTLNIKQHATAIRIIIILLDQTDCTTPTFTRRLQTINTKMSALTSENLQSQYRRYTKTRRQFIDFIKRPNYTPREITYLPQTNQRQIQPAQPIRPHVRFQRSPPHNQTDITTRDHTQQRTPNLQQPEQTHYTPILSTYHNHTVNINWEDATITTEIKTLNPPHSIHRHTTSKHTDHITHQQLPTWHIILYIILYKITTSWDKANSETLYQRERTVSWPTFRPLRILKATTPIMILLMLLSIPMIKATETTPQPTSNTKTIPNFNNHMDDNSIQNKPFSGIKNHFIYDWQGNTIINPSVHYYTINYQACDIHILKQHLQNMIRYLLQICNYKPKNITEQKHLIRTQDSNHILLNRQMNIAQARQICNSLNSKLIEIRTAQQARLLETFMTKNGINKTFSGIYYDSGLHEFLYTNGDYVTDKEGTSKKLPPPFRDYYNSLTTWTVINTLATKSSDYRPIFLYSKAGTSHLVTLASSQYGGYSINNYKKHHTSITTFPICATPRATKSRDIILQQWTNQCKITHKNLAAQLQSTIKRIAQLRPAKLPQPTKHIKLFGNYNHILKTQNPTNDQTKLQTQTITSKCTTYLSNITQLKENEKEYEQPTIKPTNPRRQKRTPTRLEFFPTATFIYNAIQFIAQIYSNYVNSHPNPKSNPNDEQTQQYIYYLTKQNAYDEDIIQTTNFISITNTQTKLQIHITKMINYINLILDILDKLYNSNYKAQPTDFLTQDHYDAIKYTIHQTYGMTIPKQLRDNKIFLNTDNNSYIMTLAIPLQPDKHNTDLFRITPMPIWRNNTRYTPKIPHKTFGIPRFGTLNFITTTEGELTKCVTNPYCETAKGTQKAIQPPCGINQFFHNNENCFYAKDRQQRNWFHQLENVIYFSIKPNTTAAMHLECSGNPYYGIGTTTQINLNDYGETTIPFNCQAHIDGNIYRPAIRTLFKHQSKNDQYIRIESLHPEPHFQLKQNNNSMIIKNTNTNINKEPYDTIFYATIILLLTLTIIALLTLQHRKNQKQTQHSKNIKEQDIQQPLHQIKRKHKKADKTQSSKEKDTQNQSTYTDLKDDLQKYYDNTQTHDHVYTQIHINNQQPQKQLLTTIKEEPIYKEHTHNEPNYNTHPNHSENGNTEKSIPIKTNTMEGNHTPQLRNIYPYVQTQNNDEICPYCKAYFHNIQEKTQHIYTHHRRP